MPENVVLVDEDDNLIGTMEKMEAHRKGLLHRAFSVFVFNDKNELMLQRRALSKYHSPGLWTNTCCSHQRLSESHIEAGKRRLREEMGFEVELNHKYSFIYKAEFDNGLIEHEYDHILAGRYNNKPKINLLEVDDWRWIKINLLKQEIIFSSEKFTPWFKIIMNKFFKDESKVV